MSSLSDHTDRLSRVAKSIKSTTARTGVSGTANNAGHGGPGPFTAAVLYTHLGDLIRDIDPSELGLFNLIRPDDPGANHARDRDNGRASRPEITRVEFPGATPLKKPFGTKETQKQKELEPEVYAQAALKYMDRYESIRPMPRAHAQVESIFEQLAAIRENMQTLNNSLEQSRILDAQQSPKDLANIEERQIQTIQTKILDLKNRKEAALKRGKGGPNKVPRSKPAVARQNMDASLPPLASSSSKTETHEEAFWSTPAPAVRTLRFESLLSDELADLGDVSTSFASPVPTSLTSQNPLALSTCEVAEDDMQHSQLEEPIIEPDETFRHLNPDSRHFDEEDENTEEVEEGEDEMTVVLKKLPPSSPIPEPPSLPPPPPIADVRSPSPVRQSNSAGTPSGAQKPRVRVTNEVERIVTKIWTTMGEIIMPGHPFDVSGTGSAGNRPPRAKETIVYLHTISTQTPLPSSPTSSSLSSHSTIPHNQAHPTPQQILTTYLIISLLSSPPHFSMPLHKVKEVLAEKAQGSLGSGRGTTSVLYGCVAKRLVRIDRGGGEQVVKFDVL